MRVTLLKIAAVAMSFGTVAVAQESENLVNVKTGAISAKLGVQYNFRWHYNDGGLTKVEGADADASSSLDLTEGKLTLSGKVYDDVAFDFGLNIENPGDYAQNNSASTLEWGHVTWDLGTVKLLGGRNYTKTGGWDHKNDDYEAHWKSHYLESALLLGDTSDVLEAHFDLAGTGTLALQLSRDVAADEDGTRYSDQTKQPAISLEYVGDFGVVRPLLQYTTYDEGHSNEIALGVNVMVAGLDLYLDYVMNSVNKKEGDTSKTPPEDVQDTHSNIALTASYDAGTVRPMFHYSMYSHKQAPDDTEDDGKSKIGVGADFLNWGEGFVPYVALTNMAHQENALPVAGEATSGLMLSLGAHGEF